MSLHTFSYRFLTVLVCLILFDSYLARAESEKSCVPIYFKETNSEEEHTELCPTQGNIVEVREDFGEEKKFLRTDDPQMRAVLNHDEIDSIGLCFLPLENTENKNIEGRQIGLKLRALDSCNLVYVMWRFYPKSTIVILSKINKNRHAHKDCLNSGYKTIATVPLVHHKKTSNFHSLNAKINNNILTVDVDERQVWQGSLEHELSSLHGPMGIRSDNGTFIFQMDDWKNVKMNCPI